jgi:hypothetical protein
MLHYKSRLELGFLLDGSLREKQMLQGRYSGDRSYTSDYTTTTTSDYTSDPYPSSTGDPCGTPSPPEPDTPDAGSHYCPADGVRLPVREGQVSQVF